MLFKHKLLIVIAIIGAMSVSGCTLKTNKAPVSSPGDTVKSRATADPGEKTDDREKKVMTEKPTIKGLDIPAQSANYNWQLTEPKGYFRLVFWDGNPTFPFSYSADLEGKLWSAQKKTVKNKTIKSPMRW